MKRVSIILLFILVAKFTVFSQAFDGKFENKILLGYVNSKGSSGLDLQYDSGVSSFISMGLGLSFVNFSPNENSEFPAFGMVDFYLFGRGHFGDLLKMNSKTCPYLGLQLGTNSVGAHIGFKYSFSELFGVYAQYTQSFMKGFFPMILNNNDNYFYGKPFLSAGITISLND